MAIPSGRTWRHGPAMGQERARFRLPKRMAPESALLYEATRSPPVTDRLAGKERRACLEESSPRLNLTVRQKTPDFSEAIAKTAQPTTIRKHFTRHIGHTVTADAKGSGILTPNQHTRALKWNTPQQ